MIHRRRRSGLKDLHSNRILGYSLDGRMKASLAVAALDHAVVLRKRAGTVVHSDRGSHFRSRRLERIDGPCKGLRR